MENKEATARIKINKLLEAADWRFFAKGSAPANIRLEPSVTIKSSDLDALGENFKKTSKDTLVRVWGEEPPLRGITREVPIA
jgi:type I restriction enzyme R subunit